jgi:phage tail-like protein
VYLDDDFTVEFVEAFDGVLAPVFATLDCLDAYLDPRLTPIDFAVWLAEWVGIVVDGTWTVDQIRGAVVDAMRFHALRGTRQGLIDGIRQYTGLTPDLEESGGAVSARSPGTVAPGVPTLFLTIRLTVPSGTTVDREKLERVVVAMKPAHVPHQIELVEASAR